IVLDTGAAESIVSTPYGRVMIAPKSTMMIDTRSAGHLRAVALAGNGSVEAGEKHFDLATGYELLSGNDLSDEELIPTDGIARGAALSAGITRGTAIKRTISLRQVMERDIMVAGSLVHVAGAHRTNQHRYAERIRKAAGAQNDLVCTELSPPG